MSDDYLGFSAIYVYCEDVCVLPDLFLWNNFTDKEFFT